MRLRYAISTIALAKLLALSAHATEQSELPMQINPQSERTLTFDWPILKVGVGEYPSGPTGVTVFHFDKKVSVAVDARGGGTGTINVPYMDIGYPLPELDTVVFAGGSWYGLEATTAVASALKDDGIRDGDAFSAVPNIAMSVGSIIFDFGGRRLNEIYPDKRLAQAAFRGAKTGSFPLGPHGAGALTVTGGLFGCNAHSGQGGAFFEQGDLKIAVFTVVNALGVVVDRNGQVAACYKGNDWPDTLKASELLSHYSFGSWPQEQQGSAKNTTVSLVVTNQALGPAELKRFAVQVHTSMARALQPFATIYDGDVLYAVSTQELKEQKKSVVDLGIIAGELMWDAILTSIPKQPPLPIASDKTIPPQQQRETVGEYQFADNVTLKLYRKNGKLYGKANGKRAIFAFQKAKPLQIKLSSDGQLFVPWRYPLVLKKDGDKLILNPGPWQQVGRLQTS